MRLWERQDDASKRIFRNIWQYFGQILGRRIQKSPQLRALRDTPAKAPENVWGDFPKSNSTKSSLKYQNILWTKRQFQTKNENRHFLKHLQLKSERKVVPPELWIGIEVTSTQWEKKGKGLLNAATTVTGWNGPWWEEEGERIERVLKDNKKSEEI